VKKWDADLIREQFGMPGCRSLLRLDKEVTRQGQLQSFETHYYLSSLDPDVVSAPEFQDYIQRHWEVENCLPLTKDKEYREDKHVVCGWGEAWTVLTNMALSLAGLMRQGERTLREIRECCAANPTNTAKQLGIKGKTC
jgi:predicted transposase YbfD/YdcC